MQPLDAPNLLRDGHAHDVGEESIVTIALVCCAGAPAWWLHAPDHGGGGGQSRSLSLVHTHTLRQEGGREKTDMEDVQRHG